MRNEGENIYVSVAASRSNETTLYSLDDIESMLDYWREIITEMSLK